MNRDRIWSSNKCTKNETNDRQDGTPEDNLFINDILIEKDISFKYQGSLINVKLDDDDEEVRTRRGIVCQTFRKLQ